MEGGFVRIYFAPIFFLTMSTLSLALEVYRTSSRFRLRLSSSRLTAIQEAYDPYSQRWVTVVAGLFCTYAAIRTLIDGVGTSWLWFLAAAAQFAIPPVRRRAGVNLGAVEVRPDVVTQHRRRRALWFAAAAMVCLFAAQQALHYAARYNNNFVGVIGVILLVAMLAGFTAAGWAGIWVSKEPVPDKESSPPPHA
jgi:hypothetical protein